MSFKILWRHNYAALVKYCEEYGTCNVRKRHFFECILPGMGEGGSDYEYKGNLGLWLHRQRKAKKGLSKKFLTADREAQLQTLVDKGKIFTCMILIILFISMYLFIGLLLWDASCEKKEKSFLEWHIHYAALVKYGEEYGTCNISFKKSYECILPGMGENGSDYKYKGNLGLWLYTQRQVKKGHRGVLRHEREAKLQILVDKGKIVTVM
jgi:hypothetical protein